MATIIYNKKQDSLLIYFRDNRPAISEDCDGEFWLRKDPHTKELLGIEIEDFTKIFLKKYLKEIHPKRHRITLLARRGDEPPTRVTFYVTPKH